MPRRVLSNSRGGSPYRALPGNAPTCYKAFAPNGASCNSQPGRNMDVGESPAEKAGRLTEDSNGRISKLHFTTA